MSYAFDSRVRFSESGDDGRLTVPGVLDYFQDCCTFQAESIGQGQRDLAKRDRVWVLSAWQVDFLRFPLQGEAIRAVTFPYKLHGFVGLRNFTLDTQAGERLAVANSYWSFLNLRTGIPEKQTDRDLLGYVLDEKLEMEYLPRKIALPGDMEVLKPFEVQKHHLDSNRHVNNVQYVRIAMDYVPEGFAIHRLRAEYKMQARLGAVFYPAVSVNGDKAFVALLDQDRSPYAVAEFS